MAWPHTSILRLLLGIVAAIRTRSVWDASVNDFRTGGQRREVPSYTVRLFSQDPWMIHVENFVSLAQRQHLLELA
jgi:hypothetical protein